MEYTSAWIRNYVEDRSWDSDYKGTCILCLSTVYPKDPLVTINYEAFTIVTIRNVHTECMFRMIDTSRLPGGAPDEEMMKGFLENIHKKP